jgi:hypothetical protein
MKHRILKEYRGYFIEYYNKKFKRWYAGALNNYMGEMFEDHYFETFEEAEKTLLEYIKPVEVVKEYDFTEPEGALSLCED